MHLSLVSQGLLLLLPHGLIQSWVYYSTFHCSFWWLLFSCKWCKHGLSVLCSLQCHANSETDAGLITPLKVICNAHSCWLVIKRKMTYLDATNILCVHVSFVLFVSKWSLSFTHVEFMLYVYYLYPL